MTRILGSLLVGVTIAVVACGGTKKPTMTGVAPAVTPAPGGMHDPRIVELDAAIDADFAKLGVPRPAPAVTCVQPPCNATSMSVKPTQDPKCTHGESQTCKDNCTLADSICENADKICKIAKELGGDAWANGKCAGAETSCETARGKCCGCA